MTAAVQRPLMRYHGGKWKLAPWSIGHFPKHHVYVEPYGGGASVLLRKPRSYAEVYNDLDGEIVNVFRVARDRGLELKEALRLTPFARDEMMAAYAPAQDPVEQARRTIIRSAMCFGANGATSKKEWSGFRPNSRGRSIPAKTWKYYVDEFEVFIERLRGVIIENKPAFEVMAQHDAAGVQDRIECLWLSPNAVPRGFSPDSPFSAFERT